MNVYIITGASRGIGEELVKQLLNPENSILAIARTLNAQLENLAIEKNAHLIQWQKDLSEIGTIDTNLISWIQRLTVKIDSITLINNAGIIPELVPLDKIDRSQISQTLRVNLEAPMVLTSAFLNATKTWTCLRRVLNISSGAGRKAQASNSSYHASKAGLDLFTRCVALEEEAKPNGAKLCAIAPGVIETAMQTQLRGANLADFPHAAFFVQLQQTQKLTSAQECASRLLAYLKRPDYGHTIIEDIRQIQW